MLEIYRWILKSGSHDVRWEKVERIKRILTGGTYPVTPKQVAAKLIEQMLERRRGNHRRKRSRSGGKTNVSSSVGEATCLSGGSLPGTETCNKKGGRHDGGPSKRSLVAK
jgi:hypothetical protein